MKVKNYILVHGVWHEKWVWERVVKGLQETGHKVTAPDLLLHFKNKQGLNTITLRSYEDHIEVHIRPTPFSNFQKSFKPKPVAKFKNRFHKDFYKNFMLPKSIF